MNVRIRPWSFDDIEELANIANNKKIWDNVRDRLPHPYTITDAEEWISFQQNQNPVLSFCVEANGKVAGSIGLMPKEDIHRISMEIGYFIGERFWGKGVASSAIHQILQYAEDNLQVIRVYAGVFENNKASMKVLEKNGFHLEGIQKNAVIKNNLVMNEYIWVKFMHLSGG